MGVTVSNSSNFCRWYPIQTETKRAKYSTIEQTSAGQIVCQQRDIENENIKHEKLFIIKHFSTIQKSVYKHIYQQCSKIAKKKLSSICRLVDIEQVILNQFCSTQYSIKAIFQYYDISLSNQLRRKIYSKEYFTSVFILEVFKFLIDIVSEARKNDIKITELSLQGIKITPQKKLKYRNPLEEEYFLHDEKEKFMYFPPQILNHKNSVIFSVGMVLLALCLNDDCSDCYDFKTRNFCWSLLEEKLMNLQSNSRKMPDLFIEGIYGMLIKDPSQRMTLDQISDLYTQILREIRSQGDKSLNILREVTSVNNIHENEKFSAILDSAQKKPFKPYYDEIIRHL